MAEKRELLVFGEKTFKISVDPESKITFGPFAPPGKHGYADGRQGNAVGTLRIYDPAKSDKIIAVFSPVTGFRDTSLDYMEEVAREEGATIWKSDEKGYSREDKRSGTREWVVPAIPAPADDQPF